MKRYKILVVLLVGIIAGIYFIAENIATKNYDWKLIPRPADSNISSEYLNAQKAVDYYRQLIEAHPDVTKNYIELAQIYLQEARITGRYHEYIPNAVRLTETVLSRDPKNFDALITRASIYMTQHQFIEAKETAERAILINQHNAFAYGVLCDAYNELGEYDNAVKACDKMLSIRPDLRSYSRASFIREIHGQTNEAIEAMKLAANSGLFGNENRAWALYNLGNLFLNAGKSDTAEFIYKGILEERPGYGFAYNGLAKTCIAKKDYTGAIKYLKHAVKRTDEHEFLENLAGIYRALGDNDKESKYVKMVMKEFNEHSSAGWNVNREFALFCADHNINLDEALLRIKKEFSMRPSNIDVLDTYAWVLFKLNKINEAMPLIEKALRLNTNNNSFYYHAAAIYEKSGNHSRAAFYAAKANLNNGFMNVLYANDCRRILSTMQEIAYSNKSTKRALLFTKRD